MTTETTTKVKSYEHACEILNYDPSLRPIVDHLPENRRKHIIANHELPIIVEAQNKLSNWAIDWRRKSNQIKYFAWVEVIEDDSESGFGLSLHGVNFSFADSICGSRLYLGSPEDVRYIFSEFKPMFEAIHLFK